MAGDDATPLRILLVDDNIDHVQLAMRALRAQPAWKVETVRLGSEAIARVEDGTFDLVLLDYRLPDMTGIDVLQRVRLAADAPAVIVMTSQGSEEVAMQALQLGAASYVVKTADFGKRLAFEISEWVVTRDSKGAPA